jgi:nitrogen fixation protein NifX
MNDAPISRDIALRIGLAVRALGDTDAKRILRVLEDLVGMPPTKKKLDTLKRKDLKVAAGGELAEMSPEELDELLTILKGTSDLEPLPEAEPYAEGDMPDSIRVVFSSNSAENLDGHFGTCKRFLVYQVSRNEIRLVDVRLPNKCGPDEDKNAYRAALLNDCKVLYVLSIGGPAAAKVVRAGLHPIKYPSSVPARECLTQFQQILGDNAPPWLAKVMGKKPEERVRFDMEAEG